MNKTLIKENGKIAFGYQEDNGDIEYGVVDYKSMSMELIASSCICTFDITNLMNQYKIQNYQKLPEYKDIISDINLLLKSLKEFSFGLCEVAFDIDYIDFKKVIKDLDILDSDFEELNFFLVFEFDKKYIYKVDPYQEDHTWFAAVNMIEIVESEEDFLL